MRERVSACIIKRLYPRLWTRALSQVAWLCLENCHAPLPIPIPAGYLHCFPAASTFEVPVATESAVFSIRHAKIAKDESKEDKKR